MKSKYKAKFPEIETAKCKCKRHRAGCGCISDSFIKGARINHFCCLQQCTNPDDYAQCVRVLPKYHVRDIHNWDKDGSCNFHPARTCSCKKCAEDQIKCTGEPYKTKTPLKCDFHWLPYRIECERRADEADSVICNGVTVYSPIYINNKYVIYSCMQAYYIYNVRVGPSRHRPGEELTL